MLYQVTTTTSVVTNFAQLHAFRSNTGPADKLIVDAGAYLIARGFNAAGAFLETSNWTVVINGSVVSQQFVGLTATAPLNLTVGVDGGISGDTIGVEATGSATTIKNFGVIAGTENTVGIGIKLSGGGNRTVTNSSEGVIAGAQWAIDNSAGAAGTTTITNMGLVDGDINLGFGTDTLTNSGQITGLVIGSGTIKVTNSGTIDLSVTCSTGNDTLVNSGTIGGHVNLSGGTNKLTNSGFLGSGAGDVVIGGAGNDTLINSGTIDGDIDLFGGTNTVTNSGIILDRLGFFTGGSINSVTNSGTIQNAMFSTGTNTLQNSGTIANLQGGGGVDTFTNWGIIEDLLVLTGGGDDVFNNFKVVGGVVRNGTLLNSTIIDMGTGNDTFAGGANKEQLQDNDGADVANFGAGRDTYIARYIPAGVRADGNDALNGGTGVDTYDAGTSTTAVLINLDTSAHDLSSIFPAAVLVAANTAQGDQVAGAGVKDTVLAFENANGGLSNDTIYGSAAINILSGGDGNNSLFGFGGNDTLLGGGGNDLLAGGAGKDMLKGDAGIDTFAFLEIADSGITGTTRDVIEDFADGVDTDFSGVY